MTNYFWTGATNTASTTATNWNPNGNPGAGDVVIFDNQATKDCLWAHTATGESITVDEIIIESNFAHNLQLDVIPTIKGMFLNKNLKHGSVTSAKFRSGPIASGGYKTYGSKYLLIGDSANYPSGRQNLTFDFNATAVCAFDDGQHPNIDLTGGNFTPKYTTPTGTSGKTDFYELEIKAGSFTPDVSIVADDKNKKFKFASQTTTQFVCNIPIINWGASTVEFTGVTSSTFNLPVSSTTNYNSGDFFAQYRKVILTADTAGYRIDMQDNTFLSVEEFDIGDGLLFIGPRAVNAQGSDIRTILPPKIRGSWSFSSISDGIYRSPRQASGPMPKIQGNFHITGKLDVDGLIDPTGLELNPQGSNPGGVAANTLWLNSGDSNKLYHGSSEVGGGSGGSGTVTNIATSAPITGGAITTTGTIGISAATTSAAGSMSSADKTKLDAIEASADVTDTANVTSAGALMDSEVSNLAFVKGLTAGISSMNVLVANTNVSNNDFLKVDGAQIEGRTAAEMRSDLNVADGATAYTDSDAVGANAAAINNVTVLTNNNTTAINAITVKASKCFVHLSSNQSYSSGGVKIGHDTALWNVGSDYDTTNEYYVAPRDGYYLIACSFYASATPSWAMSMIYVDENAGAGFVTRIRRPSSNGQDNMISAVIKLNTGDKVAHYAYAASSTTIQSALNTLTYFSVTELL